LQRRATIITDREPDRRLIDLAPYLVDPLVGIVSRVDTAPRQGRSPNFFHCYAQASNTRAFCAQTNFRFAGGASTDRGRALAKALGEAIERYSAAIYWREEFPLTTYMNTPFNAIRPDEFALFSQQQYDADGFPFVPFTEHTPVRWTVAKELSCTEDGRLSSAEEVLVPAAMVYSPYYYRPHQGELPIIQSISTGLACHCSWAEAAVIGLCEVIERDSVTITWQALLSRPHIKIDTLPSWLCDLVDRFDHAGYSIDLLDITTDLGVTTVLSVLRGRSREIPALVCAGAAHPDPAQAVRKSLEEVEHTREYSEALAFHSGLPPVNTASEVLDQRTHVMYWANHEHISLADFLSASSEWISFDKLADLSNKDPGRELTTLVNRIQDTGYRALVVDVTSSDVRTLGLTVVRALIPGCHPLFLGHRLRALGGSRLRDVPVKLGYSFAAGTNENHAPHPYP
jgi:ribosomal protein S12 methylthiotransferase accessory factor